MKRLRRQIRLWWYVKSGAKRRRDEAVARLAADPEFQAALRHQLWLIGEDV